MIDEQMKINDIELIKYEQERNEVLKEVSNYLYESCIISNDEVYRGLIFEEKMIAQILTFIWGFLLMGIGLIVFVQ